MKGLSLSFLLFFSAVRTQQCPDGYTQAPNLGNCYKVMVYYNTLIGQYTPTYYDNAHIDCQRSGGSLASIHSQEENDYVVRLKDADSRCYYDMVKNIGLRCVGKSCKWDDNSPVTYTNFSNAGPLNDGKTRCYGMSLISNPQWAWDEKDCNKRYNDDCWVCSAKVKPIDCFDYETQYGLGCASMFTWPLDQENAEAFCPEGGHLVSIHSNTDNSFYEKLALDAGIDGTVYIGGQFSNGKFDWIDGTSYDDTVQWATGFPNPIFGNCVQMLLSRAFGVVQGTWTNVDCTVKQPYICYRNGHETVPTLPTTPKAGAKCPPIQDFNESGSVYSPNYPLSIPGEQTCEYILKSKEGTMASVIFHSFNCQSGTSLSLFDGSDNEPFITFTSNSPSPTQAYTAMSNTLKIVFSASGDSSPVGTGWEAEFTGKPF